MPAKIKKKNMQACILRENLKSKRCTCNHSFPSLPCKVIHAMPVKNSDCKSVYSQSQTTVKTHTL